ncbi:carnitine acetyl transferase [Epithele typhae]|uniref:carnitine acetyl transferase n=1 Tax=Epithele typhae TaxID=378194 RepID=UPI0020074186|nr:carnitine acetyl transferase [Epithele typhae]KAH9913563.1 carnitine acetyl transferase [Epithele typhae]
MSRPAASSPFPTTRPTNWKHLAPPPRPGPTFAAQAALPRLPVPALADTAKKLKESLHPIAWSEQEYAEAAAKVDAFVSSEAGQELQRRLEARAAEPERPHWLEEWWDDLGYMGYRDSVHGFKEHPSHFPKTPLHRAASLVRAVMLFREQYKLGQVPPEATKEGPICMDTWRWMFDCCRMPGPTHDWAVTHAKEGDDGRSGHVVVLHKGRVWKLEPWQNGSLLSLDELQRQIQHIYDNTTKEYPGVGILTASNRDVWFKDFHALAEDPLNASIISTIHSSAFILCLDSESTSSLDDVSRQLWHGAHGPQLGLRNRWMDKPCQFVVLPNGVAGFVGEHSVMDGTPTATMCDRVLDIVASPAFASSSSETKSAMTAATDAARTLIDSQSLAVVRTAYGKALIKRLGASPDGWSQMLIQLAYARLLRARGEQRQGATYEAAATRRFFKGRTEAIRIVSAQSDAWVRSMDDAGAAREARLALFKDALKKHGSDARAAGSGLGVDRHILGLKMSMKAGEPAPEVFADSVIKRAAYWVLSTSAIYTKNFGPYGWGEVVPDGFGVAYTAGFDDFLQFTVTSRTEMPHAEFCAELERAAEDMRAMFEEPATKSRL